jgi:hypothetical protein
VEGACEKCTEWNKEPSVTIALQSKPHWGEGSRNFAKDIPHQRSLVREQYAERWKISELQVRWQKRENWKNIVFKLMRKRITVAREWEEALENYCAFRFSKRGTKPLSPQDNRTSRAMCILK